VWEKKYQEKEVKKKKSHGDRGGVGWSNYNRPLETGSDVLKWILECTMRTDEHCLIGCTLNKHSSSLQSGFAELKALRFVSKCLEIARSRSVCLHY